MLGSQTYHGTEFLEHDGDNSVYKVTLHVSVPSTLQQSCSSGLQFLVTIHTTNRLLGRRLTESSGGATSRK